MLTRANGILIRRLTGNKKGIKTGDAGSIPLLLFYALLRIQAANISASFSNISCLVFLSISPSRLTCRL
jgi:hypothetical protein